MKYFILLLFIPIILIGQVRWPGSGYTDSYTKLETRNLIRDSLDAAFSIYHIYNVYDYGAVGDGVTDDYTAINAAIDSAFADSGGTVLVGSNHVFSQTLVLKSGVKLTGIPTKHLDSWPGWLAGSVTPNLIYTGTGEAIKIHYGSFDSYQHNTQIEDLIIAYNGATTNVDGIVVDSASVIFDNVTVIDFTGDGFQLGECWYSTFYNIKANYCDSVGIKLHNEVAADPTGQVFFENPLVGHCNIGFHARNVLLADINGGTIAQSDSFTVLLEGCTGVTFNNTFFEPELGDDRTNWGTMVLLDTATIGGTIIKSSSITFHGCNFYAGQTGTQQQYNYGLVVRNTVGLRLIQNQFISYQTAAIKLQYGGYVVDKYYIDRQDFYDCTDDFNDAGSSAEGKYWDNDNSKWVIKRQGLEINTGTLKLPYSWEYPLWFGTYAVWPDSNRNFRIKSGAPAAHNEGTVFGFVNQSGVGTPQSNSVVPAGMMDMYYDTDREETFIAVGSVSDYWRQISFADSILIDQGILHFYKSGVDYTVQGDESYAITNLTATAWRVFYSDGNGNVVEQPLGASGTVWKSNGASAAPSWQSDATGIGGVAYADSIAKNGRHVTGDSLVTIAEIDSLTTDDITEGSTNLYNIPDTLSFDWGLVDTVYVEDLPGKKCPFALTIVEIAAYTDANTTTFNIEERAEATPNVPGTDAMAADLVATSTQAEQTAFENSDFAKNSWMVPSISATGDVEVLAITVRYIKQ